MLKIAIDNMIYTSYLMCCQDEKPLTPECEDHIMLADKETADIITKLVKEKQALLGCLKILHPAKSRWATPTDEQEKFIELVIKNSTEH